VRRVGALSGRDRTAIPETDSGRRHRQFRDEGMSRQGLFAEQIRLHDACLP
jgi:hypothetical protein